MKIPLSAQVALLAIFTLTACQTTSSGLPEGAVKLSQEEIESLWTDKTETWTKGAGFYGAGGVLEGVWDGGSVKGEWYAEEDGQLCENTPEWGEICTDIWRAGDQMWKKGHGKLKEIELKDGKHI